MQNNSVGEPEVWIPQSEAAPVLALSGGRLYCLFGTFFSALDHAHWVQFQVESQLVAHRTDDCRVHVAISRDPYYLPTPPTRTNQTIPALDR